MFGVSQSSNLDLQRPNAAEERRMDSLREQHRIRTLKEECGRVVYV
jgi:hypothetical protein